MEDKRLQYEEVVQQFIELSAQEVEERLENGESTILFIGKPVCPFCQKFVPKLNAVRKANKLTIYYLNSMDTETNPAIKALREKFEVPTVPQIVTIEGPNEFTNTKIDSSATEEELTAILVK